MLINVLRAYIQC